METHYQEKRLSLFAKRLEPHIRRQQADMDKLMALLAMAVSSSLPISLTDEDKLSLQIEYEQRDTYEAKVAHALVQMANQISLDRL